ncbi:MAG: thermonuclease family protein [Nitrospinae bacterium]|nr:thermonuclease family protein [Nitrospinota bacterium]
MKNRAGILIPLIMLIVAPPYAHAEELFGPYRATVIEVVDGDTLRLNVNVWPKLYEKTLFRVAGVNAPEIHGKISDCEKTAGQAAKTFTSAFVLSATEVIISGVKLEKYGRALGHLSVNSQDLGKALLAAGHARPYNGGRKELWCE